MKKIIVYCISVILLVSSICSAAESDYKFYFFGVNAKDFKGRKILPTIAGAAISFAVHEGGHFATAGLMGMDPRLETDGGLVVMADNYDDKSSDQKALFHAGGFLAQALAGTILTAIPATRHSDFSVGFNAFTAFNSTTYAFDTSSEFSDVKNLNDQGYPGPIVAFATGAYGGYLTYINLDKYKELKHEPVTNMP